MDTSNKRELANIRVLVTRPAAQSAHLADLICSKGGEAVLFPALEIQPMALNVASLSRRPADFHLIIFVSQNAVRFSLPQLQANGLPGTIRIAAVGQGTAAELQRHGLQNVVCPKQVFDSEALLEELEAFPLAQAPVLIVRGRGGRAFLGDALRERGALVEYLECYTRSKPARDMLELQSQPAGAEIAACVATSSDIVVNLFEMAGKQGRPWLRRVPFFVSHPHVAATAFMHEVELIFVAGIGDKALVDGMRTWFTRSRPAGAVS
jgi:uroporphyrinogen-III synthase